MFFDFIKKGIIFAALFLIFFWGMNYLYQEKILDETVLARTQQSFDKNKKDIQILILGDSHAQKAIDPGLIDNSFNFTSGGENYIRNYYKLLKITEQNQTPQLKAVVLPFDLHSFSAQRSEKIGNEWYWKRYLDYGELMNYFGFYYYVRARINSFFPLMGEGEKTLYQFIVRQDISKLYKGYNPGYNDFSKKDDKEKIAAKKAEGHLGGKNNYDPVLVSYFYKLLGLAGEENLKVYLVSYPVSEEYYSQAKNFINPDDYYNEVMSQVESYQNIEIINWSKVFFDHPEYFDDSDHLNYKGAEELSKMLNNKIKKE